MRPLVPVLACGLAVLALLAPAASAQDHDHASVGGLTILHDVPDDGRTFAGNLDHFGVLLRDDDGRPAFHSDVEVQVLWNGIELWSMGAPSGHDYDALWTWAQSFPGPGAYEIRTRLPGGEWMSFTGPVGPMPTGEDSNATLAWSVPETAVARQPAAFTADVTVGGVRVPHSDIEWRVYDEALHEVFRVQTHIHDEPVTFDYAFPQGGVYVVVATAFQAFPSADDRRFAQVTETTTVTVAGGVPGVPDLPGLALPSDILPANAVATSRTDTLVLHGTYDPFTSVELGQPIRLGVIVTDPDGNILPHVDLTATLMGPNGIVFESASLHEYDGVAEFVTTHHDLGVYSLLVTAQRGGSATIELPYEVRIVPNAVALGPVDVALDGPASLAACTPGDFLVSATDVLGQPYQHAEVGVVAVEPTRNAIVLATKLHTHETGTFPFRFAPAADTAFLFTAAGTTPDLAGPGLLDLAAAGSHGVAATGACPMPAVAGPLEEAESTPWPAGLAALALLVAVRSRRRQ